MEEAFFMPMFFVVSIDALCEKIEKMKDEEVSLLFGNMVASQAIRRKVIEIKQTLSSDDLIS